eukprot:TRINITY_DN12746_c0_g1_i3.p1 TRINITY_DN12746_c0_g1~~TRINITY_DN12746_c0_g1_i3.p1  ORF type:complete len:322 (+),score=51.71 TRINITY_DN12746_c0_g1_i3:64-1029(+)
MCIRDRVSTQSTWGIIPNQKIRKTMSDAPYQQLDSTSKKKAKGEDADHHGAAHSLDAPLHPTATRPKTPEVFDVEDSHDIFSAGTSSRESYKFDNDFSMRGRTLIRMFLSAIAVHIAQMLIVSIVSPAKHRQSRVLVDSIFVLALACSFLLYSAYTWLQSGEEKIPGRTLAILAIALSTLLFILWSFTAKREDLEFLLGAMVLMRIIYLPLVYFDRGKSLYNNSMRLLLLLPLVLIVVFIKYEEWPEGDDWFFFVLPIAGVIGDYYLCKEFVKKHIVVLELEKDIPKLFAGLITSFTALIVAVIFLCFLLLGTIESAFKTS